MYLYLYGLYILGLVCSVPDDFSVVLKWLLGLCSVNTIIWICHKPTLELSLGVTVSPWFLPLMVDGESDAIFILRLAFLMRTDTVRNMSLRWNRSNIGLLFYQTVDVFCYIPTNPITRNSVQDGDWLISVS